MGKISNTARLFLSYGKIINRLIVDSKNVDDADLKEAFNVLIEFYGAKETKVLSELHDVFKEAEK